MSDLSNLRAMIEALEKARELASDIYTPTQFLGPLTAPHHITAALRQAGRDLAEEEQRHMPVMDLTGNIPADGRWHGVRAVKG